MKRFLISACLFPGLVGMMCAATPRPINDGASNTLLLAEREGSYEQQGGSLATAETGEIPVAGSAAKHTVWYRYQAPVAGRFIVDIKDDQGLRAELRFPGNPAATIPLQTIADGTSNTIGLDEERLSVDLARGQWIYLVVDAEKPFDFSWRFVEVVNDTYKDAETLTGPIGTVKRSDKGATLSPYEESLGFIAPAVWFQWTAQSSGSYFVDLHGSRDHGSGVFGKYSVYVYSASNGAPDDLLIKAEGNGVGIGTVAPFDAVAGQVYYFACHGFSSQADNQLWFSWYPNGAQRVLEWADPEVRVSESDGAAKPVLLLLYGGFSANPAAAIAVTSPGGPGAPATHGSDYSQNMVSVGFAGLDRHRQVNIPIVADDVAEPLESFTLGLTSPTGAQIRDGTSNTILIGEEITNGACGFVQREVRVREGHSAYLEIRRLQPGTQQVVMGWKVGADGSAEAGIDMPALSGTATIAANELSTFIEIPTYQDGAFEDAESFAVSLSESPVAGSITDGTSNTIVVIEEDDYFVPKTGRYCGLVNTDGWGALVKCAVSNAGAATGTVDYQGVKYAFRGVFDPLGQLVVPLQRGTRPPLGLRLKFGEGWNTCEASVRDPEGTWADGSVRLLPYDGKKAIAPQAGAYTVLCSGGEDVDVPFVVTGSVKSNGTAAFLGRMADGSPVTFSSSVALGDGSVRGECAFVAPLYGKKGNFYGTFELGLGPQQPGGESTQWWLKPWRPSDAIYPALPFQTCASSVIRYTPPPAGTRITAPFESSLGDGSVRFIGGGTVVDGTSNTIQIGENNQVTAPPNCTIKINPKNGTFTGKITPSGSAPIPFYGAFVQGTYGYGLGFYLGEERAGTVTIDAVN